MQGFLKSGVVLAAAVLGALWAPNPALAQISKDIIGTWTLVSNHTVTSDSKKAENFGANPKGMLIFDANGHFSVIVMRADLPKFAAKTNREGTPAEYKAVGQGMLVTFGKYSVNEADKTITTDIEGSSFPNLTDGHQKRIVTSLTADELKYRNPTGADGNTVELVWKRAK
jgi:hypothetical protein